MIKQNHTVTAEKITNELHKKLMIPHVYFNPWVREGTAARAMLSYMLKHHLGMTNTEVAEYIRWKSEDSVHRSIRELRQGKYDSAYSVVDRPSIVWCDRFFNDLAYGNPEGR